MGERGPDKKPSAAKEAAGTYRADRDAEIEVRPELPEPPDWLGPIALAEWRHRGPQLAAAGLISPLDQVAFALWCQSYEQLLLAYREVVENASFTAESEAGNLYQHPAVAVLHKARSDLVKIGRQFGMTPSARAGLKPAGGSEDPTDPLDEMARRRAEYERQSSAPSSESSEPSPRAKRKKRSTKKQTAKTAKKRTTKNAAASKATKKKAAKRKATKTKSSTSKRKQKSAE